MLPTFASPLIISDGLAYNICPIQNLITIALLMSTRGTTDEEDLTERIQALLADGETLLWWDKLSDKSLVGGFGKALIFFALLINGFILLLIFAPSLLPGAGSLGWLLLPLVLVDGICLLFILLYFAFGLMTGGVNAISDQRVLLADLHKKRIVRHMRLDAMRAIRVKPERRGRGSITFFRADTADTRATATCPRRLSLAGIRHLDRVLALLRGQTDLLDNPASERRRR